METEPLLTEAAVLEMASKEIAKSPEAQRFLIKLCAIFLDEIQYFSQDQSLVTVRLLRLIWNIKKLFKQLGIENFFNKYDVSAEELEILQEEYLRCAESGKISSETNEIITDLDAAIDILAKITILRSPANSLILLLYRGSFLFYMGVVVCLCWVSAISDQESHSGANIDHGSGNLCYFPSEEDLGADFFWIQAIESAAERLNKALDDERDFKAVLAENNNHCFAVIYIYPTVWELQELCGSDAMACAVITPGRLGEVYVGGTGYDFDHAETAVIHELAHTLGKGHYESPLMNSSNKITASDDEIREIFSQTD